MCWLGELKHLNRLLAVTNSSLVGLLLVSHQLTGIWTEMRY